ncbi:MAG: hypothetical protein ACOC9T_01135 [Myxococcota bacterium]
MEPVSSGTGSIVYAGGQQPADGGNTLPNSTGQETNEERPTTRRQVEVAPDRIKAALKEYDRLAERAKVRREPITLGNGIKLRPEPIPEQAVRLAVRKIQLPEVPVVDGMENPLDPDYQQAMDEAQTQRLQAYQELIMYMGLHPHEIPEGMHGPDDPEWLEPLHAAGVEDRTLDDMTTSERRYNWLKMYALADPWDLTLAVTSYTPRFGIQVEEVIAAVDWFRGRASRGADLETENARGDQDGDRGDEPDSGDGS